MGMANLSQETEAPPAPKTHHRGIDADTERAARAFLKQLEGKYHIREAILFGSRARGDHKADSDADIAVILKAPAVTATKSPVTWQALNSTS